MKSVCKSIGVLLLLLFTVTALIACSGGGESGETDGTKDTADNTPLLLIEGETAYFRLVRPDECSATVMTAFTDLNKALTDTVGVKAELATDWKKKNESYDSESVEILVGGTAYPETATALSMIGYGDYAATVVGNKLVLAGWTDDGTEAAVAWFIENLPSLLTEGRMALSRGWTTVSTVNSSLNRVSAVEAKALEGYTELFDGSEMLTLSGATADGFERYITKLEGEGFSLITRNEMAENRFASLENGEETLILAYYHADGTMTVTIGKTSDTPVPDGQAEEGKKVCEPQLTLMGVEINADDNNGLGAVIRLENGEFIIVDGGYERAEDAALLYRTLKEQAPDRDNIVIAAWIFTHLHSDHVGAFIKFTPSYKDKVTVERFIYAPAPGNYPEAQYGYHLTMGRLTGSYSGAVTYHARTGQKYTMAGAEIEFLFTTENLYPAGDYVQANSNSLIFTVTVAGEKILFTGDAPDISMKFVNENYGSYIACDILQAAHHGAAHGDPTPSSPYLSAIQTFYRTADPSVVLWPTSEAHYTDWVLTKRRPAVDILLSDDREQVLSSNQNKIVTLPLTK